MRRLLYALVLTLCACGTNPSAATVTPDASGADDVSEDAQRDAAGDVEREVGSDAAGDAPPDAVDVSPDVPGPDVCETPWGTGRISLDDARLAGARVAIEGDTEQGRRALVVGSSNLPMLVGVSDGEPMVLAEFSELGGLTPVASWGGRWLLADSDLLTIVVAEIRDDGATIVDEYPTGARWIDVHAGDYGLVWIDGDGRAWISEWRASVRETVDAGIAWLDAGAYRARLFDDAAGGAPYVYAMHGGDAVLGRVQPGNAPSVLGRAPLPNATPNDAAFVSVPGSGWLAVGHRLGFSLYRMNAVGIEEVASVANREFGAVEQVRFIGAPEAFDDGVRLALAQDGATRTVIASVNGTEYTGEVEGFAWLGGAPLVGGDVLGTTSVAVSLPSGLPIDDGVPFLATPGLRPVATVVDIDGTGSPEVLLAFADSYDTQALRLDRDAGAVPIGNDVQGLAARYDTCEVVDGDVLPSVICLGNFLVRLALEDEVVVWRRIGNEFFDLVLGTAWGSDRMAVLPGGIVMVVDAARFDGLEQFPVPDEDVGRAVFVVDASEAPERAPQLVSVSPGWDGVTSYIADGGAPEWAVWGAAGVERWTGTDVRDGLPGTASPLSSAPAVDAAAIRRAGGGSDTLLLAGATGVRELVVGQAVAEGPVVELGGAPVSVWGRRDGSEPVRWAAVDDVGGVWVDAGDPAPTRVATLPLTPRDVAAGDFDGDGYIDVLVSSASPDGVAVLWGCGAAP